MAVGLWTRVFVAPFVARIADARGERKRMMIALAAVSLAVYCGFAAAGRLWHYVLLAGVAGAAYPLLIPLGDTLTLRRVEAERVDYGRIRLWGSLAFVAASIAAGRALHHVTDAAILPMVIGGIAVTLLSCVALPGGERAPAAGPPAPGAAVRLVLSPAFLLFLGATALIGASHAVYYTFGSIHWRAAGYSETAVGLLWGEGVVAEVLLFVVASHITSRIRPASLLALAGAAGVVRWTVLGMTTHPAALVFAQSLHALTFGIAHLAAMGFLAGSVKDELAATAQSVYSTVAGGIALGAGTSIAGALYERFEGGAYYAGAGLAAAGALLAVILGRRSGERVQESAP